MAHKLNKRTRDALRFSAETRSLGATGTRTITDDVFLDGSTPAEINLDAEFKPAKPLFADGDDLVQAGLKGGILGATTAFFGRLGEGLQEQAAERDEFEKVQKDREARLIKSATIFKTQTDYQLNLAEILNDDTDAVDRVKRVQTLQKGTLDGLARMPGLNLSKGALQVIAARLDRIGQKGLVAAAKNERMISVDRSNALLATAEAEQLNTLMAESFAAGAADPNSITGVLQSIEAAEAREVLFSIVRERSDTSGPQKAAKEQAIIALQGQNVARGAFRQVIKGGLGGSALSQGQIVGTTSEGRPIVNNGDGSLSTERTETITDPRINGGRPTNIPTMFEGRLVPLDEAANRIAEANGIDPETGRKLPGFDTLDLAAKAASIRSNELLKDPNIAKALDRPATLEAAEAFISAFREMEPTDAINIKTRNALADEFEADLRDLKAGQRVEVKRARAEAGTAVEAILGGRDFNDLEPLKTRLQALGDDATLVKIAAAESLFTETKAFIQLPPAEQRVRLDAAKAAGVKNDLDNARLDAFTKMHALTLDAVRNSDKDILTFFEQARGRALPPIDFSTPETLATSINARANDADTIAELYGLRRVPLFKPAEAADAVKQFKEAQGADRLAFGLQLQAASGSRFGTLVSELRNAGLPNGFQPAVVMVANDATKADIGRTLMEALDIKDADLMPDAKARKRVTDGFTQQFMRSGRMGSVMFNQSTVLKSPDYKKFANDLRASAERLALVYGATDESNAAARAYRDVYGGFTTIDDSTLAHVYATVGDVGDVSQLEDGLRVARDRIAGSIGFKAKAVGGKRAVETFKDDLRNRGVWVNAPDSMFGTIAFVLVDPINGAPVEDSAGDPLVLLVDEAMKLGTPDSQRPFGDAGGS